MDELTAFERAVLEALLTGQSMALQRLRDQLKCCAVTRRDWSSAGFYTYMSVPPGVDRASTATDVVRIGDVGAEIEGLRYGAGFILYVKEGVLDVLEGYSYDEPWPEEIRAFSVKYTRSGTRVPPSGLG